MPGSFANCDRRGKSGSIPTAAVYERNCKSKRQVGQCERTFGWSEITVRHWSSAIARRGRCRPQCGMRSVPQLKSAATWFGRNTSAPRDRSIRAPGQFRRSGLQQSCDCLIEAVEAVVDDAQCVEVVRVLESEPHGRFGERKCGTRVGMLGWACDAQTRQVVECGRILQIQLEQCLVVRDRLSEITATLTSPSAVAVRLGLGPVRRRDSGLCPTPDRRPDRRGQRHRLVPRVEQCSSRQL